MKETFIISYKELGFENGIYKTIDGQLLTLELINIVQNFEINGDDIDSYQSDGTLVFLCKNDGKHYISEFLSDCFLDEQIFVRPFEFSELLDNDMLTKLSTLWFNDEIIEFSQVENEKRKVYTRKDVEYLLRNGKMPEKKKQKKNTASENLEKIFDEQKKNARLYKGFDFVAHMSNGLIRVEKDGKAGYIDIFGQTIIPLIYGAGSGNFSDDGTAFVSLNGKHIKIDKNGNEVKSL